MSCTNATKKEISIGYLAEWGSLVPPLQHTAYADKIIGHEYESLVSVDETGKVVAGIAKSWTLSDDKKTYTFIIDKTKRYSDGSYISASDIKHSWEISLSMTSIAAKKGQLDALEMTAGFNEEEAKLPGVVVQSDDVIVIQLEKPFRRFLHFISGSRFAIFKKNEERHIGTGPFIIKELSQSELFLTPNIHNTSKVSTNIRIKQIDQTKVDSIETYLLDGTVDMIQYATKVSEDICMNNKVLSCKLGKATVHALVLLNSKTSKIFNRKENRQALQYIYWKTFSRDMLPSDQIASFSPNSQSYLELMPGELLPSEVEKIIDAGKVFVPSLLKELERQKLEFQGSKQDNWISKVFLAAGINFTSNSNTFNFKETQIRAIKEGQADGIIYGASVGDADPDSIYHILGQNGALSSETFASKKVSDLLKEGRGIYSSQEMEQHYNKVNRAILEEVPYIHLGFIRKVDIYRKDKVRINAEKTDSGAEFLQFEPI